MPAFKPYEAAETRQVRCDSLQRSARRPTVELSLGAVLALVLGWNSHHLDEGELRSV